MAFLMYVTGKSPQDDDDGHLAARFAQAVADARALLARRPLTTAFDDERRPGTLAPYVLVAMRRHAELRPLLDPFQHLGFPEDRPITTTIVPFRFLVDACVDEAMVRGAAVMYLLAEDGTR
ncbi:MAG: hypothetical protein ACRD26_15995 [Vicinamibacterales bacterium]